MTLPEKLSLPLALALLVACQGCKSPFQLLTRQTDRSAWGEPTWGPAAEGLQCRLRPDKRTWQFTETTEFNFDLRNRGKRTFAFWPAHKLELAEIQFDGKWHRWPDAIMIDSHAWPLAPGSQYNAVTIDLDERFGIETKPGRHIIRIAYSLEGVRVVSNPVGIEILPPK